MLAAPTCATCCHWLSTGQEVFPAMLAEIDAAQTTVALETYIYAPGPLGERFRDALVRAQNRGVRVRVLIDALGSIGLPESFWLTLRNAGGLVRLFNPISLHRFGIRDHRKVLVCDDRVAFIGGFNISPEYEGDGVTCGWCDVGLKLEGPLVLPIAATFDEMFDRADFQHKRFVRLRKSLSRSNRPVQGCSEELLLSGPGRGLSPIKRALQSDLSRAKDVRIIVAYFLPTWRIRRLLTRVVHGGGRVQLILAGKSDVLLSQLAGQSLYRRLLRAGLEIYEYQPQILHAKLMIIDDVVYVGSANLDQRSLNINYELMIRFSNEGMAAQAREVFQNNLQHCRQITREQWRKSRSVWRRIKQHWSYFLLARVDPYIALRQWRALPD
jgi:cardiolipin synthase A/B